jgi:hypothetical protein
LVYD